MSLWGLTTDELSQARTKKKEFLAQKERLVPWSERIEEMRPRYYKGERGNKPYELELMLRLYVLQNPYKINRRPSQSKNNSARSKAQIKRREREKSSIRAKVERVFPLVKSRFRYRKTRCRGLQKQAAKLNMVFALANLMLADRPGLAA